MSYVTQSLGAETQPTGLCFDLTTSPQGYPTLSGAPLRSAMKATLVGWEIVDPPSGPLVPNQVGVQVHQPPEANAVSAAPFFQTSPLQVGNLFRWVEQKLTQGQGIVLVPPSAWSKCEDLMRWADPGARMGALATRSIVEAKSTLAAGEMAGSKPFVLFEPAGGWSEVPGPGAKMGGPHPGHTVPKPIWPYVAAGVLALLGGAWWLTKR